MELKTIKTNPKIEIIARKIKKKTTTKPTKEENKTTCVRVTQKDSTENEGYKGRKCSFLLKKINSKTSEKGIYED